MFKYSDPFFDQRQKIESLAKTEPVIAVVVAAANFERVVRRAIIALSEAPTEQLRKKMREKFGSVSKYPDAWERFTSIGKEKRLDQEIIPAWDDLRAAFKIRNQLIHGERGTTGTDFAMNHIKVILDSTESIYIACTSEAIDLNKKLPHRPKAKND